MRTLGPRAGGGFLIKGVCSLAVWIAVPAHAGVADRPWIELRSPHFVVIGDATEKRAREAAFRLEQIRAVFQAQSPSLRVDSARPLTVFALRDEDSLKALLPGYFEGRDTSVGGLFVAGPVRRFIVVRTDAEDREWNLHSVAFHEYAHLLASLNFPPLPLWLNEGLAEYYAHTRLEQGRVLVGRGAPFHMDRLQQREMLDPKELFAVDRSHELFRDQERTAVFYAQSWALTHWLLMGDKGQNRERLQELLRQLGRGARPEDAALAALGDPRELKRVLRNDVQLHGIYMQRRPAVAVADADYTSRPMSTAEVNAWRGIVHLAFDLPDQAEQAIASALAAEPASSLAHEGLAALHQLRRRLPEARSNAEKAVAADPSNVAAQMLLGNLALQAGGGGEAAAIAAFEAARAASPDFAPAWAALADLRARQSPGSDLSFSLARRAVQLEPGTLSHRFGLARRLLERGELELAQRHAERALELSATDQDRSAGRSVLDAVKAAQTKRALSDPQVAARLHGEKCDAGNVAACESLARLLREGGGGLEADPARALGLYQKACAEQRAQACSYVGYMHEKGHGVASDLVRAAAGYEKGCDGGDAWGCYSLGLVYGYGKGVAADAPRALSLYDKACEGGEVRGCLESADLFWWGAEGVAKDEARAARLYETGCEKKNMASCRGLAWCFQNGRGREQDLARAVELFTRACDGDNAVACSDLGWMHQAGEHVPRDQKRAAELYEKGCNLGHAGGCYELGRMLMRGDELAADVQRGFCLVERACNDGEQEACAALADSYRLGWGIEANLEKAETIARTACERDELYGCYALGAVLVDARSPEAAPLLRRSCEGGIPAGCHALAMLHLSGRGVSRDERETARLLDLACDQSFSPACHDLAELYEYSGPLRSLAKAKAYRQKACEAGFKPDCER